MIVRPSWSLRRATEQDAEELCAINVAAWRATYPGIVPTELLDALDPAEHAPRWRSFLCRPAPTAVFLAVRADQAIGAFCGVGPIRQAADAHPELPTGELQAIYANPPMRGTGAGNAVHDAGLAYLAGQGFQHAVLWVMRENRASREFYEARGWRADAIEHELDLLGRRIPEVRYSRPLRMADQPSSV